MAVDDVVKLRRISRDRKLTITLASSDVTACNAMPRHRMRMSSWLSMSESEQRKN